LNEEEECKMKNQGISQFLVLHSSFIILHFFFMVIMM